VITGVGLVTPLGCGTSVNWDRLLRGESGIGAVQRFDASMIAAQVAGEVRDFEPERFVARKDVRRMDRFILYGLAASLMAAEEARLTLPLADPDRVGVVIGSGVGGLESIEEAAPFIVNRDARRVSPFFVPRIVPNMAAGQVSIRLGARGSGYAPASACASGAQALADACVLVRDGRQDIVFAGGAEAAVCFTGLAGFAAMRALSTRYNDAPTRASRPFDAERDGFVLSEGAGVLVVEALEHAQRRGAPVIAELAGFGATSDAYHLTQPAPEGAGAARCMAAALADAGLQPTDIDYVNAHGTGTPFNDAAETQAIKHVFGKHARALSISSTKSMTGHLLGAAGAIEAAYTALTLREGVVPPTINLDTPDPDCDLDYVPHQARPLAARAALSNSFGFGGANLTLAFRRFDHYGEKV
jgi:3-oxoacyl-[acyl-carrier-protein] synthase II